MAVKYVRWDADDRVSAQWYAVLSAAKAAGVSFLVTDGHRTMAEQQDRYETFLAGGPRAAKPSPIAPHIRTGRADHAIDVNARDGGAARLASWLRKQGADASFPIADEDWHIEVPGDDLARLAKRFGDPLSGYPAKERRWIRTYDALMRRKREGHDAPDGPERRARLRALMTTRRKAIWRAAQHTGWHQLQRRARYRSLLARTHNP
jgi:phage gp16-like protein